MSQKTNLQSENHGISLQEAIDLTTRYRNEKDNLIRPEFLGKDILPISEYFNRDAFDELLDEDGCEGIRAYFCMDAELRIKLLFVGVNEMDEDLLPLAVLNDLAGGGYSIQENGIRCPPSCPPQNPINPNP